jgi:hypothetical protein
VLAVAPLLALMIFLGFYPKPLVDVITPAVDATMQDAGFTDPAPTSADRRRRHRRRDGLRTTCAPTSCPRTWPTGPSSRC